MTKRNVGFSELREYRRDDANETETKTRQHTLVGTFDWFWCTATFFNDASTFSSFAFLFFLQFFSGFLTEQQLLSDALKIKSAQINRVSFIGLTSFSVRVLTRSFFFLSGVMKPFFAFLAFEASSIRLRTSARLRSISACLAFFAYTYSK